jgi:hypothetical protein
VSKLGTKGAETLLHALLSFSLALCLSETRRRPFVAALQEAVQAV